MMRMLLAAVFVSVVGSALAQEPVVPPVTAPSPQAKVEAAAPLPNIESLIAKAMARADANRELAKSYTCKQTVVADELDSHGNNKGRHTNEYQVFFVQKHEIHQHMLHDGQPLSAKDAAKEQERVDKLVADIKAGKVKERNAEAPRISALLKIAAVSEPRREMVHGRATIFFHFKGNPKADAHGPIEEVMKKMEGTVALDETTGGPVHVDGTLTENYHIMGGLLVNIKKGSRFSLDTIRLNDEVWFAKDITYHVDGRILLFKGFDGDGSITFSDYRKMKTTITLLPGSQVIGEDGKPLPNVEAEPEPPQ